MLDDCVRAKRFQRLGGEAETGQHTRHARATRRGEIRQRVADHHGLRGVGTDAPRSLIKMLGVGFPYMKGIGAENSSEPFADAKRVDQEKGKAFWLVRADPDLPARTGEKVDGVLG